MDLGIALPHAGRYASREGIVRVAQEAERLGYASVWVFERLLRPVNPRNSPGGRPGLWPEVYATVYDPIETLTYVAAETERIQLGTSVIDALFHVPVVLARRLATLDQLSNGRVIAGLGQGWSEDEFSTANVPLKRRGAGLEEFVAAVRAVWGPDPVRFSGRFYRIPESQIGPKPVQPGGPPILLGAFAPPAVERAARIADGLNPTMTAWETFERTVNTFRSAARAAGRDPEALRIVVRANSRVSETPLADPRTPLSGSIDQIARDLVRVGGLGVDHVFFSVPQMSVDEQVRILERLRTATA